MRASREDLPLPEGELRALLDLVAGSDLLELEVEREGLRVCIRRDPASVPPSAATVALIEAPAPDPPASPASPLREVASPWVGVFYRSVGVGDVVAPGDAVGTVEALRMRHQVEAEMAGVVEEVLVDDGHAVEYGQVLVRLRIEQPD